MSAERIKSWPTKERPRERILAEGPERLTYADLLAIILRIGSGTFRQGVPATNAYEAALSILRDFRGLRGLGRARIHDLLKVPGLGPAKVAQIKAAFELGKRVSAGSSFNTFTATTAKRSSRWIKNGRLNMAGEVLERTLLFIPRREAGPLLSWSNARPSP